MSAKNVRVHTLSVLVEDIAVVPRETSRPEIVSRERVLDGFRLTSLTLVGELIDSTNLPTGHWEGDFFPSATEPTELRVSSSETCTVEDCPEDGRAVGDIAGESRILTVSKTVTSLNGLDVDSLLS